MVYSLPPPEEVAPSMMGIKERSFAPLENISLEDLVPKDNFYRRLEDKNSISPSSSGNCWPTAMPLHLVVPASIQWCSSSYSWGCSLKGYALSASSCRSPLTV
jgi:hypothetical protein